MQMVPTSHPDRLSDTTTVYKVYTLAEPSYSSIPSCVCFLAGLLARIDFARALSEILVVQGNAAL